MEEIDSQVEMPEGDLVECIVEGLQDNSQAATVLHTARTMREFETVLKIYEKKKAERNLMPLQMMRPAANNSTKQWAPIAIAAIELRLEGVLTSR